MSSIRIKPIDGWRAIAALGVLWTHSWATTKFDSIKIASVDLFKAINIVGNGVHLFFIISGFCMYLVFRKFEEINTSIFFSFVYKRWIRIAPAFYFACIIVGIYNFVNNGESLFSRLFYNFLFLTNIVPGSVISAPFWSLAVEWHFYILLPFIF